jgi:hypothetical protein
MNWARKEKSTPAQLAVEHLMSRLSDLPVGRSMVLSDRAENGGLLVKRYAKHTLVFQRIGLRVREW